MIKTRVLFTLLLTFSVMTPAALDSKSWYQLNRITQVVKTYSAALDKKAARYVEMSMMINKEGVFPLRKKLAECRLTDQKCNLIRMQLAGEENTSAFYNRQYDMTQRLDKKMRKLYSKVAQCGNSYELRYATFNQELVACNKKKSKANCARYENRDSSRWRSYKALKSIKKQCQPMIMKLYLEVMMTHPIAKMP